MEEGKEGGERREEEGERVGRGGEVRGGERIGRREERRGERREWKEEVGEEDVRGHEVQSCCWGVPLLNECKG